MLLKENEVEKIKEAEKSHMEPKLEKYVGRHCKTRLVGSIYGLVIVMIKHSN